MEVMYYDCISKHPEFVEDVAHYSRLDEEPRGDRSYAFLRDAVNRYLRRSRQRLLREENSKAIGGQSAAPGPDKGKGKGKGKD